ncbi:glutamyl-tRNA reductase [Shewanella decolorationis]|uniref:Glutamyl-trna reductase n=1 Tax=Shewanella decolorationis S12 TaxID=1353536 RepID=A0ABP2Z2J6_9GAMM|nr:glutamyl-tRNA reductase [Shewanella decolorationis]ESE40802.1 glutamyl-trna reductase [Shewanella decolorationis S12]GLR30922.1 hypothetical protein GCM10007922_04790 [Shewanella decolorationis]
MTSNVAQHQTELSADIKLVNELIELTQTGVDFYTRANTTVDDYSLKRIFIAQIKTYQGMLARFKQLLAQSLQQMGPNSVPPSQTRPYADVDALLIKQQLADALVVLCELERQRLNHLKQLIKKANHPRLISQLAEDIAWLQIHLDTLHLRSQAL